MMDCKGVEVKTVNHIVSELQSLPYFCNSIVAQILEKVEIKTKVHITSVKENGWFVELYCADES